MAMKKILTVSIAIAIAIVAMATGAKLWVHSHSGNHWSVDVEDLDSISFAEPGILELSFYEKTLSNSGGRFTLGITANRPWTASVNDPGLILGATSGEGNAKLAVTALPNADEDNSYTAIITITLSNGIYKQAVIVVGDKHLAPSFAVVDDKLNAVYAHLQGEHGYVDGLGYWSLQENTTDECVVPTRYLGDWYDGGAFQTLHNHLFTYSTREIVEDNAWAFLMNGIAKINSMIDWMKENKYVESYPAIFAELCVFRAWYHMLLMDSFGNIPYVSRMEKDGYKPVQCTRAAACDSIMTDLLTYVPKLSEDKIYGRINKHVGNMILAKMYLNAKAWGIVGQSKQFPASAAECYQKAVEYCDDVITKGGYILEPNYFSNFSVNNENSTESLWSVYYDATYSKGLKFHLWTLHQSSKESFGFKVEPWNGYCTTHKVLGIYGEGDVRINSWERGAQKKATGDVIEVKVSVDLETYERMPKYVRKPKDWPKTVEDFKALLTDGKTSVDFMFPAYFTDTITTLSNSYRYKIYNVFEGARFKKFKYETGAGTYMDNDFPIYRLADVYLMKAEALMRANGGTATPDAIIAANQVRSRAGAKAYDVSTLTLGELCNERCRELCWEGFRRQDLIRFNCFTGAYSVENSSDPYNLWILKIEECQPYDCEPGARRRVTPEYMKVFPIPRFVLEEHTYFLQNVGY